MAREKSLRLVMHLTLSVWGSYLTLGVLVRQDDEEVESVKNFVGVFCMLKLNFN